MMSFSLGPMALPVAPVVLLGAVGGASWLASRLVLRSAPIGGTQAPAAMAGNTVITAAWLGLLVARLVYLALDADLYRAAPWSAFDLRDGGWHAPAGVLVGAGWLVWRAWHAPVLRRPLAVAGLSGIAFWIAASAAIGLGTNQAMPSVMLTELASSAPVSLAQAARGRPVVVNLWATWCGPCRQEMPTLAAAQQRETAVGFLFVNQGESPAAVHAYLASQGLALREVLLDSGAQLGPAVGSQGLPTTLFYDARGRQVDAHFGVLNAAALASRLRQLQATR